ncbi:MAG: asparagine synthase (glutamine-hydrolyzing) [Phycisphaerae bacterium]|nr:asparagine synthase (glutamine-hydrolyzing) [Phycisphaerae bacterium]
MCGIAGVIDYSGRPVEAQALAAARDALAHRGPDDSGLWRHEADGFFAALVHTRLAVLDPSPAGHQPFADPAGRYHITYNGEIYNFHDLQDELAGDYAFRTQCDTETLLAALIRWGPEALGRFNGMWAFAFVDLAGRAGWLARDRFGIKPLYYATGHGGAGASATWLAFASEMRALVPLLRERGVSLEIDREALRLYLSLGFVQHPLTIFRGIRKLAPGHRLAFANGRIEPPERFYRIPAASPPDYETAQVELRTRLAAAVGARRLSDVPLGAFLSGGLDSAVVVAELARHSGSRVKTFSIGYADQPQYDETRFARAVAERFGTEHHEFRLTPTDVLGAIDPLLEHMAEPFADSSLIPTSLVSYHTRQHVTVALSGDGGDELFAGYWRYRGHDYLRRYRRLPAPLRRWLIEPLLAAAPAAKSSGWLNRLRQARKLLRAGSDDPFECHAAWSRLAEVGVVEDLCPEGGGIDLAERLRDAGRGLGPDAGQPDALSAILLADLAFSLPADMLAKVDTASMFHSLEVRVPMLDPAVVQFVAGLPIEYKRRGGQQKRILRDAYAGLLPPEVLRRRKMGFEVPIGEFMRRELREAYLDTVRDSTLRELGLTPSVASSLWQEHQSRRAERADVLYALFVLCRWRERWS